jgi:hypothetical protein
MRPSTARVYQLRHLFNVNSLGAWTTIISPYVSSASRFLNSFF